MQRVSGRLVNFFFVRSIVPQLQPGAPARTRPAMRQPAAPARARPAMRHPAAPAPPVWVSGVMSAAAPMVASWPWCHGAKGVL